MVDYRAQELVFDRLVFRSAINQELRSRVLVDEGGTVKSETLEGGSAVELWVRDGIRWHDGAPFGPEDVCFTIAAMLDDATPSPIAKPYREAIAACEVVKSENAVIVHFKKVFLHPLERLQFAVIPKHAFASTAVTPDSDFGVHPIGTGPMAAVRERKDVLFTAFPNPHHTGNIAGAVLVEGGDPFVNARKLLNGDVEGLIDVGPSLIRDLAASPDVVLVPQHIRGFWFVAVNTTKGPLADVRVRQALNLTIDRTTLIAAEFGDNAGMTAELASGPFMPSSPYNNKAINPVASADLAKAASLMKAAGASMKDGTWVWTDGQPITLKLGANSPLEAELPEGYAAIVAQLVAGGFDWILYRITADDYARKAVTGQMMDFDLMIGKWSFGPIEDVGPLFHSRTKDGKGALNVFNYSNPAVDALLDRFDAAKSDGEALDACHELHATLADDLPYLFLWHLDTVSAWRREVRDVTIAPYYYFTEFDSWKFDDTSPTSPFTTP